MQKKQSPLRVIFFILTILFLFFCCTKTSNNDTALKKEGFYAMNVVVSHLPFWAQSKAMWESLEQHYNVKMKYGGPQNDDSQKQINEIEALITQRVNGLVIAPTDSKALTQTINKAVNSGIPVITYLVDSPDSKRLTYITSTLEEASKSIGNYAITKRGIVEGKVLISIGTSGSEEQTRRANGFREILSDYPSLKIVDVIEDKFDTEVGADNIKAVLSREKSVAYIFGCNSRSAAAAKLALEELGYKPGDIVITGWDHDDDVLLLIEKGWVLTSAAQQTSFMTLLAFDILYAYSNNFIYPPNLNLEESSTSPIPNKIEIPITLITQENASAYHTKK